LFLIAKNLKHIQVWVAVNEADIGSISEGQPVTFTVDALPNQVFQGRVGKIRLNATMSQNVVTYTVEVNTNNDDSKLLPYLTANAKFIVGRRQGVLLVPNAALRWSPRPNQIAPNLRQRSRAGSQRRRESTAYVQDKRPQEGGLVWVPQGKFVRPIRVTTGLTDGMFTEVEGRDLAESLSVVVGEQTEETRSKPVTETSPFTPQIGRGFRQGQGGSGGPGGNR
jgi:HlyD family secretion protein